MKVAIDARKLFDGGIGTYIRGVVGGLAAMREGPELVALVAPQDLGRVDWPGRGVREVAVVAGKYGWSEHLVVPRIAAREGAELLHEPHYTLPLGWRGRSVVTIHDLIHIRFPHFHPPGAALYARAIAGHAARRARVVLVPSQHTRSEVVELLGVPESKVRVTLEAPTPGLARAPEDQVASYLVSRDLPPRYLLYVGARKAHKNLQLVLRALAWIPAGERPSLVLSGDRWTAGDPLERLSRSLGIERSIHFAGNPTTEELARLYSGASLYVQPSLAEGFGLPPLEAMACETPVLSSDRGSLPEVLGDAACLMSPESPEAWSEAIERLRRNGQERARLIEAGRARAATFSYERTAAATFEAYREAMA